MTRAQLHGVTILADATMAMVTFPQGRPRRYFIRTTDELRIANDEPQYGCSCASCEYREAQRAERLVARRYVFGADGSYVKRGAL